MRRVAATEAGGSHSIFLPPLYFGAQEVMQGDDPKDFTTDFVLNDHELIEGFEQHALEVAHGLVATADGGGTRDGGAFGGDGGFGFGAGEDAGEFAVLFDREVLVGVLFEQLLEHGGFEAGHDDGIEAGESGNGELLPAVEIARRADVFDLVAVLGEDRFVEVLTVHFAADGLADERADHEGRHEGKFMGHFEDNEDAGDGSAHNRAQAGAHADDGESEGIRAADGPFQADDAAHDHADHAAEKQGGGEDAATAIKAVAREGGDEFGHEQDGGNFPTEVVSQSAGEIGVAEAEHAQMPGTGEHNDSQGPGDECSGQGDKPQRDMVVELAFVAEANGAALKIDADQSGERRDDGRKQVTEPGDVIRADEGEGRLLADQPVHDQRAQNGSEQHATQKAAVQVPDDFLQNKGGGGERSVKGGGETGGRTRSSSGAAVLFGFTSQFGEVGTDGSGQLNAGAFASQTRTAAQTEHASEELDPDDSEGQHTKILPERELKLRNAATGGARAKGTEQPANREGGGNYDQETADGESGDGIVREPDQAQLINPVGGGLEGHGRRTGGQSVEAGLNDAASFFGQPLKKLTDNDRGHSPLFSYIFDSIKAKI